MRTFGVSIEDGRVVCDHEEMKVSPHYCEDFAVVLDKKFAKDYKLNVELQGKAKNMLEVDRLDEGITILKDDCGTRGKAKFSIELTPIGDAPVVGPLDPIIDND